MTVVIIDYGMGNLHSVSKALEVVGAEVLISSNPDDLKQAERIVLPGVGSFSQGIQHLRELNFPEALREQVVVRKKPFLGICLGMQLVAKTGREGGVQEGLGWVDAEVVRFNFKDNELKVPHMGWDDVKFIKDSPLFSGMKSPTTLYFVHSYHFVPTNLQIITGICDYGGEFIASVSQKNIHLLQFHPEKSQDKGLQILKNFLAVDGGK